MTGPRPSTPGGPSHGRGLFEMMTSREILLAALLWLAVLGVNCATITRSPTVWHDEVYFADPAVNFARGEGFHSTAWTLVDEGTFWPGVVPLYGFMLGAWLKLTGVDMAQVRLLPVLLAALAAAWIWALARRRGHAADAREGLWLLALLLCPSCVSFSYRSGRPDALAMLGLAAVYAAAFAPSRAGRSWGLLLAGCAVPWCGSFLLPAAAVGAAAALYFGFREWFGRITALGLGCILGAASMASFLHLTGSLESFMACARGYQDGICSPVFRWKLNGMKDPGFLALAGLAVLSCAACVRRRGEARLPAALVLFAAAAPVVMAILGKFPVYYAWIACFPLAIAAPRLLAVLPAGAAHRAGLACLVVAVASGLPLRTALVALEWRARDHGAVEAFAARHFTAQDRVVCDFSAYYPLKGTAAKLYPRDTNALDAMPAGARSRISAACLLPGVREGDLEAAYGGRWVRVAEMAGVPGWRGRPAPYRLAAFRRQGE